MDDATLRLVICDVVRLAVVEALLKRPGWKDNRSSPKEFKITKILIHAFAIVYMTVVSSSSQCANNF
jgi:hypothetical protein